MAGPVNRETAAKMPLSPYEVNYSQDAQRALTSGSGWFGPLRPLAPIAPPAVAGRRWDITSGFNLNIQPRPYQKVSYQDLRDLSDGFDMLRTVIETRKDQMGRMRWSIKPKLGLDNKPRCKSDDPRIAAITKFFLRPAHDMTWSVWLRVLLEDLFVLDAPTLYRRRTRGGKLFSLEPIDGATVAVKLDDWGRRPLPPETAYQQVLKGYPAVDYTSDQLLWRPRNVRVHKVYGYSPVEQIIMTVNIALRRQVFQLQYYTEGNVPEALIGVPDTWSPDMIQSFQDYWDAYFEGNTASRRHAKFVPGGVAKTYVATKEPELKNTFDEWLARVVCFAFSISPQPFIAQMNRATAENAQEVAKEEGLEPFLLWVKELVDEIILVDFDAADDVEFAWNEDTEVDPEKQAQVLTAYLKGAMVTVNEAREEIGYDPVDDPSANKLMALTPTGYVPIDQALGSDGETIHPDEQAQQAHDLAMQGKQADHALGEKSADSAFGRSEKGKDNEVKRQAKQAGDGGKPPAQKLAKRGVKVKSRHAVMHSHAGLMVPRAKVKKKVLQAFRAAAKEAAKTIRGAAKFAKAEGDKTPDEIAAEIVASLDLEAIKDLAEVEPYIEQAAGAAGSELLAQLGVADRGELVDQVSELSAGIAEERAAQLVTDVTEATKEMLRGEIAQGLRDNVGLDGIAERVEALDARVFSEERADLIARTEVGMANAAAALETAKASQEATGMTIHKEWLADAEACDDCKENAEAGPIPLDEAFPSGDDSPLAHPNCECALGEVVVDAGD